MSKTAFIATICSVILLAIMYGAFLIFGDQMKDYSNQKSIPASEEEQYDKIESAFDGRYPEKYKDFPYIYNLETKIVYEENTDELLETDFYKKSRFEYLEKINSPSWNGLLPHKVEIHIKERWNNTPAQIKQLFELSKAMEKNEVLFATIVYNPTTNLDNTPSVWFTISDDSNNVQGLAKFDDIKTVEDIENTDTLYRGYFPSYLSYETLEDDFTYDSDDYETVKFDGSGI